MENPSSVSKDKVWKKLDMYPSHPPKLQTLKSLWPWTPQVLKSPLWYTGSFKSHIPHESGPLRCCLLLYLIQFPGRVSASPVGCKGDFVLSSTLLHSSLLFFPLYTRESKLSPPLVSPLHEKRLLCCRQEPFQLRWQPSRKIQRACVLVPSTAKMPSAGMWARHHHAQKAMTRGLRKRRCPWMASAR